MSKIHTTNQVIFNHIDRKLLKWFTVNQRRCTKKREIGLKGTEKKKTARFRLRKISLITGEVPHKQLVIP